jgi:hypothetical protein
MGAVKHLAIQDDRVRQPDQIHKVYLRDGSILSGKGAPLVNYGAVLRPEIWPVASRGWTNGKHQEISAYTRTACSVGDEAE